MAASSESGILKWNAQRRKIGAWMHVDEAVHDRIRDLKVFTSPLNDSGSTYECWYSSKRGGFIVKQFSPKQLELVSSLAKQLGAIRGVQAVVLGGSYARGRA